jgi:hypothetical protein
VVEGKLAADFFNADQGVKWIHRAPFLSGAFCSTEKVAASAIESARFRMEGAKNRMNG